MRTSEEINDLATALAIAQGEIDDATKDATNPHFKSNYADLAAVRSVIRLPLAKAGLSYVQLPRVEQDGMVCVETMLMHKTGQYISETLSLPVTKRDAQGIGSAITYARRYGLMAMLGLAAQDDDGNAAVRPNPGSRPAVVEMDFDALKDEGESRAAGGIEALKAWWTNLDAAERKALGPGELERLKRMVPAPVAAE